MSSSTSNKVLTTATKSQSHKNLRSIELIAQVYVRKKPPMRSASTNKTQATKSTEPSQQESNNKPIDGQNNSILRMSVTAQQYRRYSSYQNSSQTQSQQQVISASSPTLNPIKAVPSSSAFKKVCLPDTKSNRPETYHFGADTTKKTNHLNPFTHLPLSTQQQYATFIRRAYSSNPNTNKNTPFRTIFSISNKNSSHLFAKQSKQDSSLSQNLSESILASSESMIYGQPTPEINRVKTCHRTLIYQRAQLTKYQNCYSYSTKQNIKEEDSDEDEGNDLRKRFNYQECYEQNIGVFNSNENELSMIQDSQIQKERSNANQASRSQLNQMNDSSDLLSILKGLDTQEDECHVLLRQNKDTRNDKVPQLFKKPSRQGLRSKQQMLDDLKNLINPNKENIEQEVANQGLSRIQLSTSKHLQQILDMKKRLQEQSKSLRPLRF